MKKFSSVLIIAILLTACSLQNMLSEAEADELLRNSFSRFLGPAGYDFDLSFNLQAELPENLNKEVQTGALDFNLSIAGSSDLSRPEKGQGEYNLKLKGSMTPGQPVLDLELDVIKIAEELYLNFQKAGDYLPSKMTKGWLLLDLERLSSLPLLSSTQSQDYYGPFVGELDQEGREKLAAYLRDHSLVNISKIYPDTTLNGIPVHHFSAELDPVSLKAYILKAAEVQEIELSQTDLERFAEFSETLYALLEVYLGVEDQQIYKVIGNLRYEKDLGDSKLQVNGSYRVELSNFGKKLSLQAPAGATDLMSQLPALDPESELMQKMQAPACQRAMREIQALGTSPDPEILAEKSRRLREACG